MDSAPDDPRVFNADDVIFIPLSSTDPSPRSPVPEAVNDNGQLASCSPDACAVLPVELRFAALCLSPPWPDAALTQPLAPSLFEDVDDTKYVTREKIGGRPRVDRDARAELCEQLEAGLELLWRARLAGAARSHTPRQREGIRLARQLLHERQQHLPRKEIRDIVQRVRRRVLQKN